MFELVFFMLFTPGVSGFFCTSSDLELSYTFCESDVAFLKIVFTVWYEGAKALHWREVLCSGTDDEYSLCGKLKGETTETEFDIKGKRTSFPKGYYTVVLQAFSDVSEQNVIMCLNFTMIVKQDPF
ncbi:lymphocyte antigen 96 isoform X2 [Tympanuchus pallidicinctus]|uniref:lymphocyte antigen 96 isoform X2 n=1 Tax=Tympanuchus pallidicinctus TaxID=109042 RepID=UPI002286E9AF|nr:lymphocyte antigen 96 isoform X2 [Tympanuchus pallidicinctus]